MTLHFSVNWLAVVLAVVASMALGMGWYTLLADRWIAATGRKKDELMGAGGSVTPFIWGAACQLVMAYFIALLTPSVMGVTNVVNAVLLAAHLWLGFVITSMILNHRYQNQKWALTLIDGGYLLGVMIVQGIVIGLFG
jgi:Protein of unknown function (DUF1761)